MKTLRSHLKKKHLDIFTGPNPDACFYFSKIKVEEYARSRRFNREFNLKRVIRISDNWTESEYRGQRGPAALGLFFLEDQHGNILEETQKALVEYREILDEDVMKDYLKTVSTKTSGHF